MKTKKSENDHIAALGDKWPLALAAASMSVRLDPKLVGLDKIRGPLAISAALKATGCPDHEGFCGPAQCRSGSSRLSGDRRRGICSCCRVRAVQASRGSGVGCGMTKRQRQTDLRRRCLIEATIDPLVPFPRGFARSKMGPFFELRTVHALIGTGELRVVRPERGRHRMQVTAGAA